MDNLARQGETSTSPDSLWKRMQDIFRESDMRMIRIYQNINSTWLDVSFALLEQSLDLEGEKQRVFLDPWFSFEWYFPSGDFSRISTLCHIQKCFEALLDYFIQSEKWEDLFFWIEHYERFKKIWGTIDFRTFHKYPQALKQISKICNSMIEEYRKSSSKEILEQYRKIIHFSQSQWFYRNIEIIVELTNRNNIVSENK